MPELIPSARAMTYWALGTGILGGLATVILSSKIEKKEVDFGKLLLGIALASAGNFLAIQLIGKGGEA